MKLSQAKTLIGCKYYKMISDDECDILRVQEAKSRDGKVELICKNEAGESVKYAPEDLLRGYTKLIPDGIISFTIGFMKSGDGKGYQDIIVSMYTAENMASGARYPSVICRQNVVDFTYSMISGEEDHKNVGVCVARSDVPRNMNYDILSMVDDVNKFWVINFYITDTINDILSVLGNHKQVMINQVLENGFQEFIKAQHAFDVGQDSLNGHCRNLKTLLTENNYQYTHDQAFNILPVKFSIKECLEHVDEGNGIEYDKLNKELTTELGYIFQSKISRAIALEYNHDIDLTKIPADSVIMLRDITGSVWLIRATTEGKYLESELDAEMMKQYAEDINMVAKYGSGKRAK